MLGTESETQKRGTLLRGCEEVMALVLLEKIGFQGTKAQLISLSSKK